MATSDRVHVIRLSTEQIPEVEAVSEYFEGNVSMTLRKLVALGLTAWEQGVREPADLTNALAEPVA